MLEVYRVKQSAETEFAEWIKKQPSVEEISRMYSDDETVVFLLRNTSGSELVGKQIPGYGIDIKRIPQVRYNFEFEDLSALREILDPDSQSTIGADYIYDLIDESVKNARPVTAKVTDTGETYVIIRKNKQLTPVAVQ